MTPSSSESVCQAETISHRVRMVEHEIRFLVGLPVGFGRRSKQDFPRIAKDMWSDGRQNYLTKVALIGAIPTI